MDAGAACDAAVAGLLVWIAWEDIRRFRIANRLVVALALSFPVACLVQGQAGLLVPHGIFALGALCVLLLGFAAGICGGGDAKLLAAALLWIGPEGTFVFAALLLPAVAAYAGGARLRLLPARGEGRGMRIPLGPCIAAAWIGVIGLPHLTG
jgi:prepilin peptidase CpaA